MPPRTATRSTLQKPTNVHPCVRKPARRRTTRPLLPALLTTLALAAPALAGIIASGDVSPANPLTWTATTTATIGNSSTGSVTVNAGSTLLNNAATLGNGTGSNGTVTVDGPTSAWTLGSSLNVGYNGTGTLNIANGSQVTASSTYLAVSPGSTGTINFGPGGGTLTTKSLYASPSQLSGVGTINARGLVSDIDLLFDSTHPVSQTLTLGGPGRNITVNLNLADGTGDLGVGYYGAATLTIGNGVKVTSSHGYLGTQPGSIGTATVSGAGSTWTSGSITVVSGSLNILGGGNVTDTTGKIGGLPGGSATVTVSGTGSGWTNNGSLFVGNFSAGTLQISNGGAAGSLYLCYIGSTATGTTTVDGPGSIFWTGSALYVGGSRDGILKLTKGGAAMTSSTTYIGNNGAATGTVIVDGTGSVWNSYGAIDVGYGGKGLLNITHGAKVICHIPSPSTLGYNFGSSGIVTVDGAGSSWSVGSALYIGSSGYGTGTVNIINGGDISATYAVLAPSCLLAMTVGDLSSFDLATGTLTNSGMIRLSAAPGAALGNYFPINAKTWSGAGTVQALGGTWDSTTHQFTVTAPAAAIANTPLTFDRHLTQRALITDPASHLTVEANFLPTTSASNLTFTASALAPAEASALESLIPDNAAILAGWTFTASGYTPGDPVFLSLDLGQAYTADQLAIYHYDGSIWTPYSASDLSCAGAFANFTVTGFSGYAVTTLPEPAGLALLVLGGLPLLTRRRRV